MAALKKGGLGSKGRGITALINSEADIIEAYNGSVMELDINKIEPNSKQPRKRFEETALEVLAESIKEFGVIQPVIVAKKDDYYELIAGERRWRASKIAGKKKIPAVVKDFSDQELFEVSLIENLQREDLNAIEEANGYKYLLDMFNLNQEEISKRIGKSRSAVANSLRLLNLDERVQDFVIEGKISGGHARTLLSLESGDLQFELAERILEDGLSVRQLEAMVKAYSENGEKEKKIKESKFNTTTYTKIQDQLGSVLGTKVSLKNKKNKGKIEIEFYSDEDLDRILGLINK